MIELVQGKQNLVRKSNGKLEPYMPEKLERCLLWATKGNHTLTQAILKDMNLRVHNKISTEKIRDEAIDVAANKISRLTPAFNEVARNLYLQKICKEIGGVKKVEYPHLRDTLKKGTRYGIFDREVVESFSEDEINELNDYIKPERDFLLFDYLGLRVFTEKYSRPYTETKKLELPQHGFMRLAMFAFWKTKENRLAKIKERYDYLSEGVFSEATPKWLNSMLYNPQMASCVLTHMLDDRTSINLTLSYLSLFSAFGGGLACDVSDLRAKGSTIRKLGRSSGPISFIKEIEAAVSAFDQLGCVSRNSYMIRVDKIKIGAQEFTPEEISTEYFYEKQKYYATQITSSVVKATEIKKNDYVMSFNLENKEIRWNKVLDVYDPIVEEERQVKIYVKHSGSTIVTSKNHPMCVLNKNDMQWEYKPTQELRPGDYIRGISKAYEVEKIDFDYSEDTKFIDFTIDRDNNYFVSSNKEEFFVIHNTRPGACCVYFPWWHYDYFDLIILKNEGGSEGDRARGLQYAVKINRILIRRYLNNENITLFDPKDTPELLNTYGEEFDKLYEEYEKKTGIRKKVVPAKDILYKFAEQRGQTGNIYAFFVENANEQTPFKYEFINSSNLCVSGDTKISIRYNQNNSTIETGIEIQNLRTYLDQFKEIYVKSHDLKTDNVVWRKILAFEQTSPRARVMRIRDSETGKEIICTPEHKIWTKNRGYVKARDLKQDDVLQIQQTDYNENDLITIEQTLITEYLDNEIPVYDITVDEAHNFYANDILIHNCTEIFLPSKGSKTKRLTAYKEIGDPIYRVQHDIDAGLISLCNLSSVNVVTWSKLPEEKKNSYMYNLIEASDNLINYAYYPVKEGEIGNKIFRPIGVGISNVAQYLAMNHTKFTDPEAEKLMFDIIEDIAYHVYYNASELAKHRGPFELFYETRWSEGWLPIDRFPDRFKRYADKKQKAQWEDLREKIQRDGIRFATCMAIAPTACQTKESEILLPHNKTISLEEIMKIQGINIKTLESIGTQQWILFKTPVTVETRQGPIDINRIWYNGKTPVRSIEFDDGSIYKFTYNHRLLNKDSNWIYVVDITAGTEILTLDGDTRRVVEIKSGEFTHTYDIEVPNVNEYVLSNGCISHNTSSLILQATEGAEPIKKLVADKTGTYSCKQLAPGINEYGEYYELAFDIPNEVLLRLAAIRQIFLDQGQSINTYYKDASSASVILKDILLAEKLGLKSLYYANPEKLTNITECDSCSS